MRYSLNGVSVIWKGERKWCLVARSCWRERERRSREWPRPLSILMLPISEYGPILIHAFCFWLYSMSYGICRLKVSHAHQSGMRTVLVKEKPANAKSVDEPQQYVEVCVCVRACVCVCVYLCPPPQCAGVGSSWSGQDSGCVRPQETWENPRGQ